MIATKSSNFLSEAVIYRGEARILHLEYVTDLTNRGATFYWTVKRQYCTLNDKERLAAYQTTTPSFIPGHQIASNPPWP